MARSGRASRAGAAKTAGADPTRRALVDAAIESLRFDGFAGASARAIAARADVNPGLIFYHFGSVADLLLAALEEVSVRRMAALLGCGRRGGDAGGACWRSRPRSSARTSTRVTSPCSPR